MGFKSFADKVLLEFHDGVTGVVGPNGCGKSNIADAFRWVMGEQSAKSMRGGKMQDIIFAGTSKRKALGLAEVSLTFVNTEMRAQIPYHEVEITRRYHRDGEAEYLINGNPVRLKDVQSMLIDVGIGKNAYAIFEQGKIDQIIQLGPEERRSIFEEAAGILKFLVNKRDAERKLAEVDLNSSRLKDIHDEVQKEIDHLTSQAGRALEYRSYKERLEILEEESLSLKIMQLRLKETRQLEEKERQAEIKKESEKKALALKQTLAGHKASMETEEAHLKARERQVYQSKASLEVREKELETIKERLQELVAKGFALEKEREEILAKRKSRKEDRVAQLSNQQSLSLSLEKQKKVLVEAQEAFHEIEQKVGKVRRDYDRAQEAILQSTKQLSSTSSEMKQKAVRFETLSEKMEQGEKEFSRAELQITGLADEEKEKRETLESSSKEVDLARGLFNTMDLEIKQLSVEIEEADRQFEYLSRDLVDLKAREKALLRLREDMEGASLGTKELIHESKREGSPLAGRLKGLWEFFDIQAGFEQAVAAALRPYGDTLVAEDIEALQLALKFAEDKKLTDFSLVSLRDQPVDPLDSSLLKKVKINRASSHFLGHKAVVENLESALDYFNKAAGFEVFSLDGFYIDHSGVLFRTSQKGSSVFLREAELKTLSDKIKGLGEESAIYQERLKTLKEQRASRIESRSALDKKVRSLEMQLVEKNFHLQKTLSEMERLRGVCRSLKEERARLALDHAQLEKELLALKGKNGEEEALLQKSADHKASLQASLEEILKQHKMCKERLLGEEGKFERESDETRKILYALNLMDVKDQESLAQERRCEDELKELETHSQALLEKQKDLNDCQNTDREAFEQISREKEALDAALREKKRIANECEKALSEQESCLKKEEQKQQAYEIALAQTVTQLEAVLLEFAEKLPGKEPRELQGSFENLDKELKKVRQQLALYTDVNMSAVESLEQHKERAAHLQKEMEDLYKACEELREIIGQLEGESRDLFRQTFEAVRANFKKNFQILFNGGEADLELTQSDDLLKAGIEIVAKPPGKQMRSINLLSGGEKCLTAMALLFSIFEVKAAPFCILDEIDAPLDDTNVDRFCHMVKHFADRCQFILITHNKRTMSIADRLYGVSMEERGVSKILMMEFQASGAHEAALV